MLYSRLLLLLCAALLQLAPLPVACDPTAATSSYVDDAAGLLGHLKPFGAQGPVTEVDRVDGFPPPEEFLTNHVKHNRPLLFKGAAKSSPAFAKWTDAYMDAKTPPRPEGDVHIEHAKKENRSANHSFIHFKEFLRDYNTSNFYMVSEVPEFLYDDLVLPFSLQCRWFVVGGLDLPMAWFSSGGTSSVIHFDSYENINCLMRGRKTLIMVNTTKFEEQTEKIIDRLDRGFSSADVDKIDLKSRPEFANLEFYSAEMEAGDCLYIPHLWLHQVRSFGSNLAINLWWSLQPSYNLTACSKQPNQYLRFSRLYFGNQVRATHSDANTLRKVLASNTELPATEHDLLTLLSNGDIARFKAVWPEFPAEAMSMFKLLDVDKDGMLSSEELTSDLKYKVAKQIKRFIMDYNVHAFAMHQQLAAASSPASPASEEAVKLPKLIRISGSDEGVYAPDRTWPVPRSEEADGEPEPDEAADEEADDEKTDSGNEAPKDAKDEL